MAKVVTDDKHYKAIANAIRNNAYGSVEGDMKPEKMAEYVGEVAYHNYHQGENQGAEVGRQEERNHFWSVFLNYGQPKTYQHAFSNSRFTDGIYNPNYPIRCIGGISVCAQYMFYASGLTDTKVEIIIENGRTLNNTFANSKELHTIRKITLLGESAFSNTFNGCEALENITFEGVISNDISFADSHLLTKASITNIINCLSAETSEKTLTLSSVAVANAFETSEGVLDGISSAEWDALGGNNREKKNWTISLV